MTPAAAAPSYLDAPGRSGLLYLASHLFHYLNPQAPEAGSRGGAGQR